MTHPRSYLLALTLLTGMLLTCGGRIEQEPILDAEGEPIEFPPPFEDWLQLESITPTPQKDLLSANPTFLIRFNQYFQEASGRSYGIVSLKTGARGASGIYEPIMVDKSLLWRPYNALRPDFEYTLKVNGTGLRSVTDAPTPPKYSRSITFRVDDTLDEETPFTLPRQQVAWPQVKTLFEERGCYECHGEPSWNRLDPLTYDSLVGGRAADVDLFLVRFKDPINSYLMHKLLPDYPVRRGTVQPPPWRDDLRTLTREELCLVEQWIRQGARQEQEE